MKPDLFVDTSGWLAFITQNDSHHAAARQAMALHRARGGQFVTTNYVLAELLPLLDVRTQLTRPQIIASIESLQSIPALEIVHVDLGLHQRAFDLLKRRPDKNWSWADAVSFILMQERAILVALSTDHHFEQAGFQRLLN